MAVRKFAGEGLLHLYSTPPVPLYPSEIYNVDALCGLREALDLCNIYLIAARQRSPIDSRSVHFVDGQIGGRMMVIGAEEWQGIDFAYPIPHEHIELLGPVVKVIGHESGAYVEIVGVRNRALIPAYAIQVASNLSRGDAADMDVLYIGQGVGRSHKRLAVDRLASHAKLQRILADVGTHAPHMEVLILLFRFEHGRVIVSTGGDLNLEPTASVEEEREHFKAMGKVNIGRKARIGLAEAALINYFQPPYNETFTRSNFSAKRRMGLLREMDANDLTGLQVEVCTANLGARLRTETRTPMDMAEIFPLDADLSRLGDELPYYTHTHIATLPLTTSEDRNTFLHGIRWRDGADI